MSRKTRILLAWFAVGCGGPSSAHRAQLEIGGLEQAREAAPDLVAAALEAASQADEAHRNGDGDAEADLVTRARLLALAAETERERIAITRERATYEEEALGLEDEIHSLESAARRAEAQAARMAAARFARAQLRAALNLAQHDESRPSRARRVELADAAQLRESARVIADRARLIAATATALGGDASEVEAILSGLGSAGDPMATLELAEGALERARHALGDARAGRAFQPSELDSLREASADLGVEWIQLEIGLGTPIDLRNAERIAAILSMYPHGPALLQAIPTGASSTAQRAAQHAAEQIRARLVAAGVGADRVRIELSPPAPAATLLVLPSYGGPAPQPVAVQ